MTHADSEITNSTPDADVLRLYELVLNGMQEYIARHEQCASFVGDGNPWDAAALYHALARAGIFDDPLAFNRFSLQVERALWQKSNALDASAILREVETILIRLGVTP
jgi:hypothetical protein